MPETWAIGGVDLHVDVPRTRVRAGLENGLRDAIRSGRLRGGTRLPSSRQLAGDLGLARNTVADAYGQLVAEGWLTAQPGSGTRVAEHTHTPAEPLPSVRDSQGARYDLRPGLPNLAAFPATAWVTALRRALLGAPADALGYSDPRGRRELREALAGYLARVRGVSATPDRIVVCSGFTQALALFSEVLRDRGATTVAIEEYGQAAHRRILTEHGLTTNFLRVDGAGADVGALDRQDGVVLTPAHQFPLGPPLSPARRTSAVAWATAGGGLIVEDDYDGEFRYDRHPIGALQVLAPDRIAYVGTASKTLAPGVRLGWVVAPSAWLDDLVAAKAVADAHSSSLDQLALAQLITSGGYDRHVRRCRLRYRRRREQLVQALRDADVRTRVSGIAAGMHAVVTLPPGLDEPTAVAVAARHGLTIEGLRDYRRSTAEESMAEQSTPDQRPALVVGYGTPPDHAYAGALARLIATLRHESSGVKARM
jgi:GntR family transcriptional regulator / MocR family aminotransferase